MSIFRYRNIIYDFVKPNYLIKENSINLIEGKVKGSSLCWNIGGGTLTYLQMAKLLKEYKLENGNKINNFVNMKQSILYILLVGLFIGCNTPKQAIKSINKGFSKDSVAAAKRVREIVPCVTLKKDTILLPEVTEITTTDTLTRVVKDTVRLKCKDGSIVDTIITKTYYDINHRTTKINTYYITSTIEDKGKDIIIRDREAEIKKQVGKKQFNFYWALIATGLLGISIIFTLIKKSL